MPGDRDYMLSDSGNITENGKYLRLYCGALNTNRQDRRPVSAGSL